mmetsp:Transcript_164566/g.527892  ORF Transcript_164566/g.527892 Transcript_164566/m.527892 type:complete len:381 (+) Transcript_164566:444-1586(+)
MLRPRTRRQLCWRWQRRRCRRRCVGDCVAEAECSGGAGADVGAAVGSIRAQALAQGRCWKHRRRCGRRFAAGAATEPSLAGAAGTRGAGTGPRCRRCGPPQPAPIPTRLSPQQPQRPRPARPRSGPPPLAGPNDTAEAGRAGCQPLHRRPHLRLCRHRRLHFGNLWRLDVDSRGPPCLRPRCRCRREGRCEDPSPRRAEGRGRCSRGGSGARGGVGADSAGSASAGAIAWPRFRRGPHRGPLRQQGAGLLGHCYLCWCCCGRPPQRGEGISVGALARRGPRCLRFVDLLPRWRRRRRKQCRRRRRRRRRGEVPVEESATGSAGGPRRAQQVAAPTRGFRHGWCQSWCFPRQRRRSPDQQGPPLRRASPRSRRRSRRRQLQ